MKLRTRTLALALWPAALCAQDTGPVEPLPSAAAPTRYRVEVIVFAHAEMDPTEEYLEVAPPRSQFSPDDTLPAWRYVDEPMLSAIGRQVDGPIDGDRSDGALPPFADDVLAVDHFRPGPEDAHLRILDSSELTLLATASRLGRLAAYTPLFHGGWEQDGLPEDQALPLDVTVFGSTNPSGTIRLHVSRYLHARVDLAYRPPVAPLGGVPQAASDRVGPVFYLYEERRLFRDKINYLDHPAFGVILLVTLAPTPTSAPAEPSDGIAPSV